MSSQAGKPSEPRPQLGPSDAVLSAPLGSYQHQDAAPAGRPVISGAADAVIGAPLTPPPAEAREGGGLQLGVDSAGGFTVPKQLDGKKRRPARPGHR